MAAITTEYAEHFEPHQIISGDTAPAKHCAETLATADWVKVVKPSDVKHPLPESVHCTPNQGCNHN
jgi:hypothetical protein